ncbi:threonine synthase [Neisseriaceae bacterium PsAf]|nr:threonine synthase [Neisseriaceae bacterium PsAf]
MKYISTRGQEAKKSFSEVLLMGLSSDGGLMMPESYPHIDSNSLNHFRSLSYPELAFAIMQQYISDIPADDLKSIINNTYTKENFQTEEITPVRKLSNGLYILGLSNGPTLAFKDIAMQFLGNAFEYVLDRQNTVLNILGATSGDTGSAAEYAIKGKNNVNVFMLSPHGKMSDFQRAQMYSLLDENIHNIAIEGLFDDCQDIVKNIQNDLDFKQKYHIGTVNSINWGRILAQIVYYFKAYFEVTNNNQEYVSFCVPSGNFGDICAGHIAKSMGLPIEKLIVATNENNVLEEFFTTGIYQPRKPDQVYITSSPSMDIAKASNLERFIFDLIGRDGKKLNQSWQQLETSGQIDLSHLLDDIKNKFGFYAGSSTHQNRLDTIRETYKSEQDLVDPHTADGIYVAKKFPNTEHLICLETALPIKFEATIKEALGNDFLVSRPDVWNKVEEKPQKIEILANDSNEVKKFIQSQVQY